MRAAMLAAAPLLLLTVECSRPSPAPDPDVRTVTLPDLPAPDLPDAPGRAAFVGACQTCHTPRYLLDQPPLPRKTWTAEVDKMRHTYGAPVPDDLVAPIVDYLVAVRGAP
jgi:mono/diheme cytochrome c family protein